MMYFPPFLNFSPYYQRYPRRPAYIPSKSHVEPKPIEPVPIEKQPKKEEVKDSSPLFEIFGLKLYFDDILLLGLLFFLYNEGVDDMNLYIALVLLLLS